MHFELNWRGAATPCMRAMPTFAAGFWSRMSWGQRRAHTSANHTQSSGDTLETLGIRTKRFELEKRYAAVLDGVSQQKEVQIPRSRCASAWLQRPYELTDKRCTRNRDEIHAESLFHLDGNRHASPLEIRGFYAVSQKY